MVSLVIFDFDGTLADSSEGIIDTALYTLKALGVNREYPEGTLRDFIGPPLLECFSRVLGLEEEKAKEAVKIYKEEYRSRGYKKMFLYPGMKETLIYLKEKNIKTAVASYKTEALVRQCVEYLKVERYFSYLTGLDEEGKRNKSDMIRAALSQFHLEKEEALMIGDTTSDLDGAKGAGVSFLSVKYGFGFKEDDIISPSVKTAYEIKSVIEKINGGRND